MPRGDNPNSRANLKPFKKEKDIKNDKNAVKAQRKIQKKGAQAANEAISVKKTFREMGEADSQEEKEKMWQMLKKRTMQGNLKAFEIYRDTIGEKPNDEVHVTGQVNNPYMGLTEDELRRLAGGDCE